MCQPSNSPRGASGADFGGAQPKRAEPDKTADPIGELLRELTTSLPQLTPEKRAVFETLISSVKAHQLAVDQFQAAQAGNAEDLALAVSALQHELAVKERGNGSRES